jgi:guanylate kinase
MEHLAEYATVHGELYGTPRKHRTGLRVQASHCVVSMSWVVWRSKQQYPETVYSDPAFVGSVAARMGGENGGAGQRRLSRARRELPYWRMYDYVVVNDRLADSVVDCLAIIRAERLRWIRAAFRGPRPVR